MPGTPGPHGHEEATPSGLVGGAPGEGGLISDYALLSDCQGSALVSTAGSVDWWCPQRFDHPSVFSRLLDPDGGHWWIGRSDGARCTRRYIPDTMLVEAVWADEHATVRITDCLLLGHGKRGHEVGHGSPHVLVREVQCLRGQADVAMDLRVRPEYGLVVPTVTSDGDERVLITGGADRLVLTSSRPVEAHPDRAAVVGNFCVSEGDVVTLALHHRTAGSDAETLDGSAATLGDTRAAWQSWVDVHRSYAGPYDEQVARSALVLQALTYQPTGAVVAAATTSLPEVPGGQANWDYRFGWLRDGSFTLKALWVAACPHEAQRFFDWMAESCGSVDGAAPVMLGVRGDRDLTERNLDHLAGYGGARPVRVGNNAWTQEQLDVYGEVLECAWILRDQLKSASPGVKRLLRSLADRAAANWGRRDAGIWEGREGDRDYVTSKVMCWVAVDRAARLADQIDGRDHLERWQAAAAEIHAAVLQRGWDDERRTFTGAFGSDHLDAGVLLVPLVGFLDPEDPRVLSTLDVIEAELAHDGLVQRWTGSGDEGGFVICSYWLAAARAMAGQVERAMRIFDSVTRHASDLGLLSEEIDLRTGEQLGNYPQGLSHIGLVRAAWEIAEAQRRAGGSHPAAQERRR